jgi:hypothetical protein
MCLWFINLVEALLRSDIIINGIRKLDDSLSLYLIVPYGNHVQSKKITMMYYTEERWYVSIESIN